MPAAKFPLSHLAYWVALISALALLSACSRGSASEPPPPVFPTITPGPQATATPSEPPAAPQPASTESIPSITRLTDAGCCAQPFWSADSKMVLFIDKPEPTSPTAIYGVPVEGGSPQIVSTQVGLPSPDGRYLAFINSNGQTTIQEVSSGQQWTIDNKGLRPFFSPSSQHLAWAETITDSSSDFSQRRTVISLANLDGSNGHEILTVYGGGIAGWLDDDRLLVAGRMHPQDSGVSIFTYHLTDGTTSNVIQEDHIRNVSVGPGGQWILYTIALDTTNSANDGLWVVKADGSQRYKLEVVGSAKWRDASHLLIIPLDPGTPSHRLWQFDAATGQATPLTDPQTDPFRVAQADWSVSPDGKYAVFVNADDQSLWLITLPPSSGK